MDYKLNKGIFGSHFIGLKNFEFLVQNGDLWNITKNTLLYNVAFLVLGNIIQIVFAIMLSEITGKWFKKISQSVILLPNFISMVIRFYQYDVGRSRAGPPRVLLRCRHLEIHYCRLQNLGQYRIRHDYLSGSHNRDQP
ncbi:putative multiple-sugar transport system permease YteP [compost metagenome]